MNAHFGVFDTIVLMLTAYSGTVIAVLHMKNRTSREHAKSAVQPPPELNERLITQFSANAAHDLLYRSCIAGDDLTEFQRYEMRNVCEKHIQRAMIGYLDTVRRSANAATPDASEIPAES